MTSGTFSRLPRKRSGNAAARMIATSTTSPPPCIRRKNTGSRGRSGVQIGKGIAGALVVPRDREHPPAVAVVEELDAVDAADEGLLAGRACELVRGEDVRDVSEDELAARDFDLEEGILLEHRRAGRDVTLDVEEVHDAAAARLRARRGELRARIEELSLAVPVARRAGRTGDDL